MLGSVVLYQIFTYIFPDCCLELYVTRGHPVSLHATVPHVGDISQAEDVSLAQRKPELEEQGPGRLSNVHHRFLMSHVCHLLLFNMRIQ